MNSLRPSQENFDNLNLKERHLFSLEDFLKLELPSKLTPSQLFNLFKEKEVLKSFYAEKEFFDQNDGICFNIEYIASKIYDNQAWKGLVDISINQIGNLEELVDFCIIMGNKNFSEKNNLKKLFETFLVFSFALSKNKEGKFLLLESQYKYFGLLLNIFMTTS